MNIDEKINSTLTNEQKKKVEAAKSPKELLTIAKKTGYLPRFFIDCGASFKYDRGSKDIRYVHNLLQILFAYKERDPMKKTILLVLVLCLCFMTFGAAFAEEAVEYDIVLIQRSSGTGGERAGRGCRGYGQRQCRAAAVPAVP
jgi:hypothetical protein